MSEEAKKEEIVEEGEVVEVDLPEEKPSGKIADLAPKEETTETEEVDVEAQQAIEDVSSEPAEKSQDELEDYSEKVQKRISKLTRKLREAERGQESAYEYAKRMSEENQHLKTRSSTLDRSYLQEAESRLNSQKQQALAALKNAHEVADYDKVAKAQEVLAKIAVEENKVTVSKAQLEQQMNVQEEQQANYQDYVQPQQQAQAQPQQDVELAETDKKWVEKNLADLVTVPMIEEKGAASDIKDYDSMVFGTLAQPSPEKIINDGIKVRKDYLPAKKRYEDSGAKNPFHLKLRDGGIVSINKMIEPLRAQR